MTANVTYPVTIVAGLLLLGALPARADLEEVVITTRMRGGYDEMPYATIRRPADFLVQEIRLVNDSRAPDLRKKEIIRTIEGLLKRAATLKNVALSYGDGFLVPVDITDESLQIIEDKKRPDTSAVDIYVKVALAAGDDVRKRITDLRRFVDDAQLAGRTEIELLGDVGLSIVNPEKYRGDILDRIAAENAALVKKMGDRCRFNMVGLEGRVQWERTDVAELTLYLPYNLELRGCTYEP
jgi:hypothetical protein